MAAPETDDRHTTTRPVGIGRLLSLGRPYWPWLLVATVCLLLSTVGFLAVPYIIRLLTDSVFLHHDSSALNRLALTLVGLVVVTAVFGFCRGYVVAYVGGRIVADLRTRVYQHLLTLPLEFYDEHRTGDLLSRVTADTTLVQTIVTNDALSAFREVVTLVAVVVIVLFLDWHLALVTFAVAPLVAALGALVGRRTRELSGRAQEQLGSATTVLEETLPAMRVVKGFGRETYEAARYANAVTVSFRTGLAAGRLRSAFEATMLTAGLGAVAAVLWFGGQEVLSGRLTPGGLISFLFYLTVLIGPLQSLGSLYGEFQQAAGGAGRIFEILDTPATIVDAPDARPLYVSDGQIEVRDLWFRYTTSDDVLCGMSLHVRGGETLAVVGPSGAGKTTLMSLLLRLYSPQRGLICIDEQNIADVTQESLRRAIAVVPQDVTLFGGSVRDNIAYGRAGASEAEIAAAARAANAEEFIQRLPEGLGTIVGDRGVKLSGGQRQRVAIARAVLRDAPILILDEATSSLDNESEALVQEALERLMRGRTTLVIAHRLTTIEKADRIAVLDRGRVVEVGSHAQLLGKQGLYYRLYTRDFAHARETVRQV